MCYLKRDSRSGEIAFDAEKANSAALQAKLDSIAKEHRDIYIDGIQPVFDPLKARHFESSWSWVRQDALMMYYDIIFGRLTTVDREITARCIHLLNRADPKCWRICSTTLTNVTHVKVKPTSWPKSSVSNSLITRAKFLANLLFIKMVCPIDSF